MIRALWFREKTAPVTNQCECQITNVNFTNFLSALLANYIQIMNYALRIANTRIVWCQHWMHSETQSLTERLVSSCIWLAYSIRSKIIGQSNARVHWAPVSCASESTHYWAPVSCVSESTHYRNVGVRALKPVSDDCDWDWIGFWPIKAKFTKLEISFLCSDWLNSNLISISITSLIQA